MQANPDLENLTFQNLKHSARRSNQQIYALFPCKVKNCLHGQHEIISESDQYLSDTQDHQIVTIKPQQGANKIVYKPICSFKMLLTQNRINLIECHRCKILFEIKPELRRTKQIAKCPRCNIFQCAACKGKVSFYGSGTCKLVACVQCEMEKHTLKQKFYNCLENIFAIIKVLSIYLVALLFYTVIMLCSAPFMVLGEAHYNAFSNFPYPKTHFIIQLLLFPFYLTFIICYIYIYFIIVLLPRTFEIYIQGIKELFN